MEDMVSLSYNLILDIIHNTALSSKNGQLKRLFNKLIFNVAYLVISNSYRLKKQVLGQSLNEKPVN